jgi:hypothetical protein
MKDRLGFGNAVLISNRRELLWSKATVMKAEKSKQDCRLSKASASPLVMCWGRTSGHGRLGARPERVMPCGEGATPLALDRGDRQWDEPDKKAAPLCDGSNPKTPEVHDRLCKRARS